MNEEELVPVKSTSSGSAVSSSHGQECSVSFQKLVTNAEDEKRGLEDKAQRAWVRANDLFSKTSLCLVKILMMITINGCTTYRLKKITYLLRIENNNKTTSNTR